LLILPNLEQSHYFSISSTNGNSMNATIL